MVKVDLITGFLGSGKTTFIKKYARYLMEQGQNIGILENDFGAINVDMMLLRELEGENCELEMVAGGCDKDCYRRRFKTKLIAMGMCGYDRVLQNIVDHWDEIRAIIAEIPSAEELAALCEKLGAFYKPEQIGIDPALSEDMLSVSAAIRNRLTLIRMRRVLDFGE